MVEATLAVLLVGGAMVAALNVAATAARTSGAAVHRRQAQALANALLAEAMSMPASGTDATNAAAGARLGNFDHILDYAGFRESPPRSFDGTACAPAGWAWQTTVTARAAEDIDGRSLAVDAYLITATVELPDGTQVRAQGLRNASATLDRPLTADASATPYVMVFAELTDGTLLYAGAPVYAQRPPEGSPATLGVR